MPGTGGATPPVDESVNGVVGAKNSYGFAFKDSWVLVPCYSVANQDCLTVLGGACPVDLAKPYEEQGNVTDEDFLVGGVTGRMYSLTITVAGITSAKYYSGGLRAAGLADPPNADAVAGTDTFYTGGLPVNFENYGVYSIRSKNMAGGEIQHYYLNSFPQTATPYENHTTYPIAFTHDIIVMGGGTITIHAAHRNCRAIDNCGIGFRATSCIPTAGRNLPNEPATVIPMSYLGGLVSSLNLRNGAAQPYHAQAIHITAIAITPM